MKEISVTELGRGLSDFINRATYRGETFLILRGGKPVASLSPVPSGASVGDLANILGHLPPLPTDDLASFESDIDAAREANNQPITDPWDS